MAVYKGMSLRMCILALAVVSVIFFSMEVVQVHADDDCNSSEILLSLSACVGLNTLPTYGSECCQDLRNCYSELKPSDSCICQTASPTLLASLKLTVQDVAELITVCLSASVVPACL